MDQDATPHRMLLERNLLFTAVTRSKHFWWSLVR
jgi:ATP-dependent exoDNAse (exonuclease V) alpha subunit